MKCGRPAGLSWFKMKPFEYAYLCAEPFLPPLYGIVRKHLKNFAASCPGRPEILDAGGRKSHYTIGVPANVTITDLPRESDTQKLLSLGITGQIIRQTRERRSNITRVLFDSMTQSGLASSRFDCVVAVEVLEHVDDDAGFVAEVCRILKPGGLFMMTTPNGDFVKNTNPDHRRHYRHKELFALLSNVFPDVEVQYAVRSGYFYGLSLRSWSWREPIGTVLAMAGGLINSIQSAFGCKSRAKGTQELLVLARKSQAVGARGENPTRSARHRGLVRTG